MWNDFTESLVFTAWINATRKNKGRENVKKTELEIGSEIIGIHNRFDFKLV